VLVVTFSYPVHRTRPAAHRHLSPHLRPAPKLHPKTSCLGAYACSYGDIHAYTAAEAVFIIIVINLNIFTVRLAA
jgi:hypothetical protein